MGDHRAKDIGMKRSASELALQEYLTKFSSSSALSRQESVVDTSPLDTSFDLMNRVSLWFLSSVVSLVHLSNLLVSTSRSRDCSKNLVFLDCRITLVS